MALDTEVWIKIVAASLSINGFLATILLKGIWSQIKGLKTSIDALKDDQHHNRTNFAVIDLKLENLAQNFKDLPCKECKE